MRITYDELNAMQKWPLEDKMEHAVAAILAGVNASKHQMAIAFSGGKDSTVLWWLFREYFPGVRPYVIFGNTGVEYPESLHFAQKLGKEWGGVQFFEARPAKLEKDCLKYQAQREVLTWLEREGEVWRVLQEDGKLKTTDALERAAPAWMMEDFELRGLVWRAGTVMDYWYCIDQYGFPILGKAKCKLDAKRINIDCFLKYSSSISESAVLLDYYKLLRHVKISQHCCKLLKKDPSEKLQAQLDVDVVFKGLMAAESRSRMLSYCTRGTLFESHRDHLGDDPFYHCNPLAIWTDADIWACIHEYGIPYSPLYDIGYRDSKGVEHKIQRNGCFGCATGIGFADNQLAMLRRTHPKLWALVMRRGMGDQLRALRLARANGQMSLMDFYSTEELMEVRPCAFDSVDRVILMDDTIAEYDAEDAEEMELAPE
ncbi:MAG: phosphoadenosine phosphosulfate reductase family protein [Candidatus Limiplasma sp.]|nr:phosphoadenosine phosphosulfate reductase family protein [Candidatus Limiplasma sp.]